jgi:hypothetical protein
MWGGQCPRAVPVTAVPAVTGTFALEFYRIFWYIYI